MRSESNTFTRSEELVSPLAPEIRSPKRRRPTEEAERDWYEYHAGFSATFVEDVLRHLGLSVPSTVLDPWNGTGITTHVAQREGHRVIGIDLSPVMMLVAKARHLESDAIVDSERLTRRITQHARRLERSAHLEVHEPLLNWFNHGSALILRSLERSVRDLFGSNGACPDLTFLDDSSSVTELAAFFYVALFRTVRKILTPFATSNPTWIKASGSEDEKLHLDRNDLIRAFAREVRATAATLNAVGAASNGYHASDARILQGSSVHLPVEANSVNAVVSSPPYCTRIDYAVATLPELRVLGCTDEALKSLRGDMIGTPTMNGNGSGEIPSQCLERWGPTALTFLEAVSQHESKASSTYYLRYFLQYFHAVELSLQEISRVLQTGSPCVLVIQDSHYKEVRLDLTSVYEEMANSLCLRSESRLNYPNGGSLARINRGVRKYRASLSAVESVLILRKS